jgi:protease-4
MRFLSTFFASLLAFFVAFGLFFIVTIAIVASSSSEPEPYIQDDTVLKIDLNGTLSMTADQDPFEALFNEGDIPLSIESLTDVLEKAAVDERISGVWLETEFIGGSWVALEEAHRLLTQFKEESGKFVLASTTDLGFDEKGYYLASTADSIYAPSQAYFEFNGFVMQLSYYQELLDKIGVEPEIFRVGKYKSAVEQWLTDEISPADREQREALLAQVKSEFLSKVSLKTGLSEAELDNLMDELYTGSMVDGHAAGLIDELAFPDEIRKAVAEAAGVDEVDDLEIVDFGRYAKVGRDEAGLQENSSDNELAVVYASGAIMPSIPSDFPFESDDAITFEALNETLNELESDDDVKGAILFIESPGGSASTSELIWNRLKAFSETKPIYTYMGSVAASGGYYIAAGTQKIYASPNTITGSIGIFRTMFNAEELMNDRLGITLSEVQTDPHADILTMTRPLTAAERRALQNATNQGYERFLEVVAESRNMTRDEVHELAQGRVWPGSMALEAGLVDGLGTLDDALAALAEEAEIQDYVTERYPAPKDPIEELFGTSSQMMAQWSIQWLPQPLKEVLNQPMMKDPKAMSRQTWALSPVKIDIQ